ncbi:MAG: acyltransferase family protein [Arachnia sp.]
MTPERLHWADTAKALAVVLVVLYHVSLTAMVAMSDVGPDPHFWGVLSTWLLPVRMPLFFLISGVLAGPALRRPWRRVMRPRVLDNVWTFWIWSFGTAALYAWAYSPQSFAETTLRALTWMFTFGGSYWYLPLLTMFFVTAKCLRRLPIIVLGGSMVLYCLAPDLPRNMGSPMANDAMLLLIRYCQFLLWFATGVFLRPLVERWARATAPVMIIATVVYVPLASRYYNGQELGLPSWLTELGVRRAHLTPLLSVLGITVALGLSRMSSRLMIVRRLSRYLAERTLPIYLVHPLAVMLLVLAVPHLGPQSASTTAILVPALVAGLVLFSTLVYDRSRDVLPWLYRSPGSPPRKRTATPGSA